MEPVEYFTLFVELNLQGHNLYAFLFSQLRRGISLFRGRGPRVATSANPYRPLRVDAHTGEALARRKEEDHIHGALWKKAERSGRGGEVVNMLTKF